jgi:hypothetical protein
MSLTRAGERVWYHLIPLTKYLEEGRQPVLIRGEPNPGSLAFLLLKMLMAWHDLPSRPRLSISICVSLHSRTLDIISANWSSLLRRCSSFWLVVFALCSTFSKSCLKIIILRRPEAEFRSDIHYYWNKCTSLGTQTDNILVIILLR